MDQEPTCVDLDRRLNELDRTYSEFARTCGISECAYWMICDTAAAGGSVAINRLTSEWFYSKQTINSALKTLTARGLVTLEYAEGSRKNKVVNLTEAGRAFAERWTEPAVVAEQRAFEALDREERMTMLRLLSKFTGALNGELQAFKESVATEEPR